MKIIASIFFLLITSVNISAQWVQTSGPSGGGVKDFTFVNGKILAATFDLGNGIYASNDTGFTWHQSGLEGMMLTRITAFNNTVLTATTHNSYNETDEIYRSSDGGDSWQSVLNVPNINGVRSICHFQNHWYFTAQGQNGGIFISTDDGLNWTKTTPASFNFTHAVQMVSSGNILVAGSDIQGTAAIFHSADGQSWTPVYDSISRAYSSAVSGNKLWFGVAGGVIYSTNEGLNWSHPKNIGIEHPQVENIISLAASGNHLVAISSLNTIYYSWDGGDKWTKLVGNGLPANASYFFSIYLLNNQYFLGSSSGIMKSQNDGINWQYSSNGLRAASISQLGASGGKIFASTERGVGYTGDAGSTWHDSENLTDLNDVVISGFHNAQNNFYAYGAGIYSWNGSSWVTIDTNVVTSLAEGGSGRLFVSCESSDPIGGKGGILISDNGGSKWDSLLIFTNTFDTEYYFLPQCIRTHGSTIIAAQRAIVFQTFGSSYFIYRSTDNGSSWQKSQIANSPSFVDFFDGVFYMGTFDGGLFQSTNDGITWSPIGFNTKSGVTSFLKINGWLFATVAGNGNIADGIYKMGTDGAGWKFANGGTTNIMGPLATDGIFLYCGGPSVWKRQLSELGVNSVKNAIFKKPTLESYPNPAGEILHLRMNPLQTVHGLLLLTNEKGSVVMKQDISLESTERDVVIPITGLAEGAYYAKFVDKSGYEIGSSRFVVMRK